MKEDRYSRNSYNSNYNVNSSSLKSKKYPDIIEQSKYLFNLNLITLKSIQILLIYLDLVKEITFTSQRLKITIFTILTTTIKEKLVYL